MDYLKNVVPFGKGIADVGQVGFEQPNVQSLRYKLLHLLHLNTTAGSMWTKQHLETGTRRLHGQ